MRIESQPTGAEVFVDQKAVGVTPVDLRVDRLRDHAVYVKKEGFQPELVVLTRRSSPEGVDYLTPADVFVSLLRLRGDAGALPASPGVRRGEGESEGAPEDETESLERGLRIDPERPDRGR